MAGSSYCIIKVVNAVPGNQYKSGHSDAFWILLIPVQGICENAGCIFLDTCLMVFYNDYIM